LRPGHDPSVRQEILKRAQEAMQRAGFELERFGELKRRSNTALLEALAKSRAAADERVPAMRDAVTRSTEYWLKANKVGDTLSPGPDVFALSTADQISVDPDFSFLSENKAPWANSAQVMVDTGPAGILEGATIFPFDGLVNFKFSFENQTGAGNLFTVNALLGVTGSCDVTANGYWIPAIGEGAPRSFLKVTGSLGIMVIGDDGGGYCPTAPVRPATGLCGARCVGRLGGRGYHCRSGPFQDVHPFVLRPVCAAEREGRVRRQLRCLFFC
jgi:hypothetical protein